MRHGPAMDSYEADEGDEFASSKGTRRFLFGLVFFAALGTAAILGYGLGREAWAVPPSIVAHTPAPLADWLHLDRLSTSPSTEALPEYAFELVDTQVKQGEAVLAVRLVHKPTGKAVPDAVIFARRIDMAPEGMAAMTAPLEALPTSKPGTYRFKTDLMMEGGWQLSLAAKVQGQTGTVQNQLLLKAVP
jgi:hypothetical protein